jgi:hypothetical protein
VNLDLFPTRFKAATSWQEIRAATVENFDGWARERREALLNGAKAACDELFETHYTGFIVIDGSFVTSTRLPNDIDVVAFLYRKGYDPTDLKYTSKWTNAFRDHWGKKYDVDLLICPVYPGNLITTPAALQSDSITVEDTIDFLRDLIERGSKHYRPKGAFTIGYP